jgi:transposase InsO family protein
MFTIRNKLTVIDKLLIYLNRLVISENTKTEMMMKLHKGHMGIVKTQARAQQTIWWPGITSMIQNTIEHCQHCQVHRNVQKAEPLKPCALPDRPWQRIDIDMLITHKGQTYMAVSDVYSRWLEIVKMPTTTATTVIASLKVMFARWGFPDVIMCDNGTEFISTEFQKYIAKCDITLETSSPRYPQSNGGAENAVKQAKKILDQPDQQTALMEYRATPPTTVGYSPCEILQAE